MPGIQFITRFAILACAFVSASGTAFADSPVARDSEGRVIGYYSGTYFTQRAMFVVSPMGYTFAVNGDGRVVPYAGPADGSQVNPDEFYFESSNCSGQAFTTAYSSFSGFVTRASTGLIYVPKGIASTFRSIGSRGNAAGGNCVQHQQTQSVVPIFPNSQQVTGVPDTDFVPPIQIVIAQGVHDILRDGYESPAT